MQQIKNIESLDTALEGAIITWFNHPRHHNLTSVVRGARSTFLFIYIEITEG